MKAIICSVLLLAASPLDGAQAQCTYPSTNFILTQAIFYFDNLCTEKGAEFGFYRQFRNAGDGAGQNQIAGGNSSRGITPSPSDPPTLDVCEIKAAKSPQ